MCAGKVTQGDLGLASFEHVLLTIDLIEGYCNGHTAETFAKDKQTIRAVFVNVRMLSRHAEGVELADRMRHPSIPWAFIRTLENVTTRFNLEDRPYLLWNLVHERLFRITEAIREEASRATRVLEPKIG